MLITSSLPSTIPLNSMDISEACELSVSFISASGIICMPAFVSPSLSFHFALVSTPEVPLFRSTIASSFIANIVAVPFILFESRLIVPAWLSLFPSLIHTSNPRVVCSSLFDGLSRVLRSCRASSTDLTVDSLALLFK